MRQKAAEGCRPSVAPLGYVNVAGPDGKRTLALDEGRAPLLARAFEWYATGDHSVKTVAAMARRAGLTFPDSGLPVSTARIHQMLRQRTYCGEFEWAGRVYRGTYPPIVSKELWQHVQDVMDGRYAARPKKRKHQFTFSGLLHCGVCGCALVGDMKKGKFYYRWSGNRIPHPEPYVREEVVAEQVQAILGGMAIEEETVQLISRTLRESHEDEKRFHNHSVARLQADIARLQARLDAMYVDKFDARISSNFYERTATE